MLLLAAVLIGGYRLYAILTERADVPDTLAAIDDGSDSDESNERMPAPDFSVEDADGNAVKLSDMAGKPVVLNIWASWCPPCRQEMPEFNKVYEELGADVHFMMVNAVGINGETKKNGSDYVANEGFTFPAYYDMKQDAVSTYGIRAFPTSFFIDSDGCIAAGVEGAIDEDTLRRGIELIRD